jgi:SPX domain protein involved in polyphosphate accumulation
VSSLPIEVFSRYEKKYLLDAASYRRVAARIAEYMEPDAYNAQTGGPYEIRNVYYDTDASALIRASLAKPCYKEKLRLRAYGEPGPETKVYVEIKKKVGGLVNKRRSAMYPSEAVRFLGFGKTETAPHMNAQVIGEVGCMLKRHMLKPSVYLAYDREAFFGIGQHDVRLSFDTNIRARRHNLTLSADGGEPLLEPGWRVMEIKAARSIPLWLCELLSEYKIYPISFSKYGKEYTAYVERTVANARFNLRWDDGYTRIHSEPAVSYFYGGGNRPLNQRGLHQNAQNT